MSSSDNPSAKYPWSFFSLMSMNGRTATERSAAAAAAAVDASIVVGGVPAWVETGKAVALAAVVARVALSRWIVYATVTMIAASAIAATATADLLRSANLKTRSVIRADSAPMGFLARYRS